MMRKYITLLAQRKTSVAVVFFVAVALAVTAPLWGGNGYVFLTDMVWGPQGGIVDVLGRHISAGTPLSLLLAWIGLAVSHPILQKMVLLLILFLPGWSMYLLSREYMRFVLALGSGLLYILNPYVYERFLIGQWVVILGYGVFPLAVLVLLRFMRAPNFRNWFFVSLALAMYPLLSIHWAYIACGFLVVSGMVGYRFVIRPRGDALRAQTFLKGALLSVVLFIILNGFWLFNFFNPTETFSNIGTGDFKAFATLADPDWGAYFNVLSLYGIWDTQYFIQKDFFDLWWVVTFVALVLSVIGAAHMIRSRGNAESKMLAITLSIVFVPTLLLAVGYASGFTKKITDMMLFVFPFYRGLRDTAKITGVLAFAYAFLIPLGCDATILRMRRLNYPLMLKFFTRGFLCVPFLISFLWAGTMINGANEQIKPYAYPQSWYAADRVLASDPDVENVLFLPWYQYLRLNFAGNAMSANPSSGFFSVPVIVGENTDNRLLALSEATPYDEIVALLAQDGSSSETIRDLLHQNHISHIILLKTDAWKVYDKIRGLDSLKVIYDSVEIEVLKVR